MRRCSFELFVAEVLSLNEPPIRAKGTRRQMSQALREFGVLPKSIDDPAFKGLTKSLEKMREKLRDLGITPTVKNVSDMRPVVIAAWIHAYPRRSPARAASLLRSFSSACTYAVAAPYLTVSPFVYRRVNQWVRDEVIAPERPRPPRYQSTEAIQRLLEMLDAEAALGGWKAGRLQALVYLFAFTGMRKAEALSLRPWDVDVERGEVSIQPRASFRPKTRKSAAKLPLAEPARAVLRLWLPRCGGEWVFPGVRLKAAWRGGPPGYKPLDEVKAAGERAGIPGLTIAGFRMTIGTMAKTWGLGQLELKALLRHSNVETQRWYDEEQVESLRPAVAKIQFRVASPGA
jgi:integrase